VFDGNTPSYRQLTASQAELDQYDAVLYACSGQADEEPVEDKARLFDPSTSSRSYISATGRVLLSHYAETWVRDQPPFDGLPWSSNSDARPTLDARVDTSFARGQTLSEWLALPGVDALSTADPPRVGIANAYLQVASPLGDVPAQSWLTTADDSASAATLFWTYDPARVSGSYRFPTGGRVAFTSFHVPAAEIPGGTAAGAVFPEECSGTVSTQDKLLAYVLFELTRCFPPSMLSAGCGSGLTCQSLSCADQGIRCGPAGDGCGWQTDCGPC
jgi:hypothetical protein